MLCLPVSLDRCEVETLDDCELLAGGFLLGETPHAAEAVSQQDAGGLADLLLAVQTRDAAVGLVDKLNEWVVT